MALLFEYEQNHCKINYYNDHTLYNSFERENVLAEITNLYNRFLTINKIITKTDDSAELE